MRLSDYGYQVGLLPKDEYKKFLKRKRYWKVRKLLEETKLLPTEETNNYLKSHQSAPIFEGVPLSILAKRPEINIEQVRPFIKEEFSNLVYEQVLLNIKYSGYIQKHTVK